MEVMMQLILIITNIEISEVKSNTCAGTGINPRNKEVLLTNTSKHNEVLLTYTSKHSEMLLTNTSKHSECC